MGDRILIVPVSRIRLFAPFLRFGNREIHTEFRHIPQFLFAAKSRSEDTRRLRGAVLRRI